MTPSQFNSRWVCFDCRKMFRKPPRTQLAPPAGGYVCPECKQPMRDMGVYFEPPRRNAVKQWSILRLIADSGFRFQSEGSVAFAQAFILEGRRPNLNRVKERLKEYKNWRGNNG